MDKEMDFYEGGMTNHSPSYKKCHYFWKANGIYLNFYSFS